MSETEAPRTGREQIRSEAAAVAAFEDPVGVLDAVASLLQCSTGETLGRLAALIGEVRRLQYRTPTEGV